MLHRTDKKVLIILFVTLVLILLVFVSVSIKGRFIEKPTVSIVLDGNQTVYDSRTKWASIHLKRGEDKVELERIDFLFSIDDREEKFTIDEESMQSILKTNSEKVYKFDLSNYEGKPSQVKILLVSKDQKEFSLMSLLTFSYYNPSYIQANLTAGSVLPEWCFLELAIKEKKTDQGIQFSFLSAQTSVGFYQNALVDPHYEGEPVDYVLRIYDYRNRLFGSYSLYSSRFIFWDNFGPDADVNPGGVIEEDEGIISVTIPYNRNIRKGAIEIIPLSEDEPIPSPTYFNIDAFKLRCEI